MDLNKLMHMYDFTLETKALGQIQCGSMNAEMHSKLRTTLESRDVDSLVFSRHVLGLVSKKVLTGDIQKGAQAQEECFTEEEISSISDEDVEVFAREFILHNGWSPHSYEDADRHVSMNEKGERSVSYTPKTSDLPKGDAESSSDYLVRVLRHYFEEQSKSLKRMMGLLLSGNTTQQSGLGTIAEVSRYLTGNSATAAMERILNRDQDLMLAIDPLKDMRRHLEENSASVAIAMQLKREQDLMRAAASPFQDAQHYLEESSVSAMLAKAIYYNEDMFREATRGLTQRETISAVIAAGLEKQQQETRDLLKIHEAMFRLPQAHEATRLLDLYQVGAVAELAQRHTKDILDRQRSLEAITTPWLHSVESARSVTAILELQGMGNALRTIKGFDLGLTAALRLDFGDWRDKITFPESVFINPVARTDFYVTRGFNTALTDFPEAAFHQSLHVAGLDGETLDFELYGTVVRPLADPEEAGLQRTNKCHDQLQRFERRLRQFINDAMTAQYGPDWPKKRLAPNLYEQWEFKKQRAESCGVILTFIEVADFTDYETIICKQDHWREIFEPRFKKKESVRESLQRLQPIRLAAMHARIVTKEDELYLFAEVVRLLNAIK